MSEGRITKLKALLEQDPNDSFSHYALALEYSGIGDTVQAVTLLEKLIAKDPSYIPSYQQLGYLYQKLGRAEEAVKIFKRGILAATQQGDAHASGEMQEALDDMES